MRYLALTVVDSQNVIPRLNFSGDGAEWALTQIQML